MNPDNVAAVALKERLKREAGFLRRQGSEKHRPAGDDKPLRTAWGGVAGMRDLKAMLERDVILPLQEPEIYAHYRLNLPNGILLYEPPGCGKTFIARKLAAVAGFSFIEVKPGDLASIYVHGIQGKIAELFAEARKQVPCMIFFDELDAMVPSPQRRRIKRRLLDIQVRLSEAQAVAEIFAPLGRGPRGDGLRKLLGPARRCVDADGIRLSDEGVQALVGAAAHRRCGDDPVELPGDAAGRRALRHRGQVNAEGFYCRRLLGSAADVASRRRSRSFSAGSSVGAWGTSWPAKARARREGWRTTNPEGRESGCRHGPRTRGGGGRTSFACSSPEGIESAARFGHRPPAKVESWERPLATTTKRRRAGQFGYVREKPAPRKTTAAA